MSTNPAERLETIVTLPSSVEAFFPCVTSAENTWLHAPCKKTLFSPH